MEAVCLTRIEATARLKIADTLEADARYLLPEVHDMLQRAANSLPEGECLLVVEAFRTQTKQFRMWNERIVDLAMDAVFKELVLPATVQKLSAVSPDGLLINYENLKFGLARKLNALATKRVSGSHAGDPDSQSALDFGVEDREKLQEWKDAVATICELVRVTIADPVDVPSGHQYGAAVDVTIMRAGEPLDMGTAWAEFTSLTTKSDRVPTASSNITANQRENREHLKRIMEAVGFINYAEEWWHYSYGDRLWKEMKDRASPSGRDDQAVQIFQPLLYNDKFRFVATREWE